MDHEPTISDVLDAVNTLSTHVDLQFDDVRTEISGLGAEIADVRSDVKGVKREMRQMKSDIMTEIDHFVGLHQKLDVELVALRSRCDRIEAR
jgi:archaellum component FlaC